MPRYNFFDDNSPYLHHPLLTEERSAREVDFLISQLLLTSSARILDVGCAFGRHSVELARRGLGVVGIDPSAAMINAARQRAMKANCIVQFQQDGGESFQSGLPFDAAICLFTTLGQIRDKEPNDGLVANVYNLLSPGGYFCVEVPQRDVAVDQMRANERFGTDEAYTLVTRQYDVAARTMTESFDVNMGTRREFQLCYYLYSEEELRSLLADVGLSVVSSFADATGAPLTVESATMLFICRKS